MSRRYLTLLARLKALTALGREDTPEADALADEMDNTWHAMTADEQGRVRALALEPEEDYRR